MHKAKGFAGRSAIGAAVASVAFAGALAQAGPYEQPPVVQASRVLPPDLLRNPAYTIDERVPVEDFQYAFTVHTPDGDFVVKGTGLMRVRAQEIAAAEKMKEIGGAGTLVESAGRTALKPLDTAKGLLTAPGKTVGETFRGVGKMFGRADAAMSATDPNKEGMIASVTGGSTARRKLAYDFGVDPHTSFGPLDAELTRLATASAVGETSTNAGLAFVTGGAGIAISAGGTSSTLRETLRDKTAAELEKEGRQVLSSLGVSETTLNAFYANPHLTPTDKAIIVEALERLGAAGGHEIFIAGAARAPSIEMGFFYRRQAELIAAYNDRIAPVQGFVRLGGAPMLVTAKGTVSILPVDYLSWTPPLEQLMAGANAERGKGPAEVWVTGTASQMAIAKLASLGWTVVPKAGAALGTVERLLRTGPRWPLRQGAAPSERSWFLR